MTTVAKAQRKTNDTVWLVGLGILVLIGLVAWIVQVTQGFQVVGVNQAVVWGAYIATFFFVAGVGAGLVILAAGADLDVLPALQPLRRSLLLGALGAFVASGFMILMDLGKPQRVFNMLLSPNFTSPFQWDFAALALAVIVTAVYLFVAPKGRWLPILAAVVAALVPVVEGWILSMSVGGTLWHGGLMPVLFVVEALLGATALVLALQPDRSVGAWLRRAVLVLLPVPLALHLFEIASISYAGHVDAQAAVALFLTGRLAPLFWGAVLVGFVLPFVLLAWVHQSRIATIVAAILVIPGVLAVKLVLLTAGQALPFMQAEALYVPTLVEVGGVIGILGLAGLLFVLGRRLVPAKAA
jgi:molybdopterin-containing oxidoreductase family membrane subunit